MAVQRNTKQKQIIYNALVELGHPSATQVYEHVRKEYPSLSRGTVFRVLNGLSEGGKAVKLQFQDSDARFDATLAPHAHAHCKRCGCVFDVEVPMLTQFQVKKGFVVEGCSVQIIGQCEACYQEK